jgi:N-acetylneuraminic acid mutarotase
MSLINALPNEILSYIATFMAPTDLRNCNSVCERLYATCHDYTLWRRFFVDVNTIACPVGRLCHTAAVHNDNMYIYGGHITQPSSEYFHTVKNDMYECNLKTREWREVPVGENAPRRTEHTSVVYNNSLIIFGGYSGNGYENSIMSFDFQTGQWVQLTTQGDSPSARSAHTASVVGNSMFIFGGWNGVHCMNDLHELDFTTMTWKLICADTSQASRLSGSANHRHSIFASPTACEINANAGDLPSARCSHGAVVFPGGDPATGFAGPVMYVFGGYAIEGANESSNKGYLDDLYEFHFDTKKWYKSKTWGSAPSPRSRFRMVSHQDSIYLFAGWNSAKHFSTLHRYCVTNHQWMEVSTTFDEDGIGQFSMVENQGIMYVFSGYSPKLGCRTNLYAYPLAPTLKQQAR